MRALTVWQPWASLIMIGAKPWEFRGKSFRDYGNAPAVGERIVIHAGARPVKPVEVEDLLKRLGRPNDHTGLVEDRARELLERIRAAHKYRLIPLAVGLGTAVIGEPKLSPEIFDIEVADGDRGNFNWGWPLSDIAWFEMPIPMRGMQGFWNWPGRIAA